MNTTEEKARDTIKKLHALATRGEGGERDNAKRMLEAVCKKHGLDIDTIILNESKRTERIFYIDSQLKFDVFGQIIFKLTHYGEGGKLSGSREKNGKRRFILELELAAVEYLDVVDAWDFYERKLDEEINALSLAFIYKHHLFDAKATQREGDVSEDEKARHRKAREVAEGLGSEQYAKTRRLT